MELPYGEKATWGDWRRRYPDSLVLSVEGREHEEHSPYEEYFANDRTFRDLEVADRRLEPKEPIFGFFLDGEPYVVPHSAVEGRRLFEVGGVRLLFFREPDAEMFASTRTWRVPVGGRRRHRSAAARRSTAGRGFRVAGRNRYVLVQLGRGQRGLGDPALARPEKDPTGPLLPRQCSTDAHPQVIEAAGGILWRRAGEVASWR